MAIGSHWPRLDLGTPDVPRILEFDKILHVVGYLGLTLLLVWARPLGRERSPRLTALAALLLAAGYAAIDEYTQPWFDRHFTTSDLMASSVGVLTGYLIATVPIVAPATALWLTQLARAIWLLLLPGLIAISVMPEGHRAMARIVAQFRRPWPGLDKDAHFYLGLVLTLLLAAAAPASRRLPKLGVALTVLLAAGSAPLLELLQRQSGRSIAEPGGDVFAHNYGVLVALVVWAAVAAVVPVIAGAWNKRSTVRVTKDSVMEDAGGDRFVGHAVTVSLLTLASRVTGLLRDAVLAAAFGLGSIADAFFIGFLVPNLFRRLFGEGALSSAFIPQYSRLRESDPELARRFASLTVALLVVLLSVITLLGEAALWVMHTAGDWSETTSLALKLTMIMLPYMPMICLVALLGGILQVHGRFGPAAAAPIILNLTLIGVAGGVGYALAWRDDPQIIVVTSLALGVLFAGLLQLLWQLGPLLAITTPTLRFDGTKPALRAMFTVMGPMILGLAAFQINALLDSLIAFTLSPKQGGAAQLHLLGMSLDHPVREGGVAALQWAQRLYQFPLGVFGIAIATAIFPALARASGDTDDTGAFERLLHQGLRLTVFIALPASVGLILVRDPLVQVVYQRGAFSAADSQRVAWVLTGYATAVWAYSMMHLLTRAFYAKDDATTPLRVSVAMLVLNLALNLTLVWKLGIAALAWSTACCAMLQAGLLVTLLRKHVARPPDGRVWRSWVDTLALSLVMATALWAFQRIVGDTPDSFTGAVAILLVQVAIGGGVILGGARLIRMEEVGWLWRRRVE